MEIKVITNEQQHRQMRAELDRLIESNPAPGSGDADRIVLIAKLLEVYEREQFHFNLPNPLDAIRFRMAEQELLQKDLIPFIGSKSKVSEVLAGKRPLTLQMIRALHAGLGIPAEILLQTSHPSEYELQDLDWQQFPIREMLKRGWIKSQYKNANQHAQELIQTFLAPLDQRFLSLALYRRTLRQRDDQVTNIYSILAWTARVLVRAKEESGLQPYKPETVTKDFLKEIAHLSWFTQGPLLAKEFLAKHGIPLIVERHLSGTKLDGAVILSDNFSPVIGLTLRNDRIDSFWYTLIHELSHILKHLKKADEIFADYDLDSDSSQAIEREADKLTRETFIPQAIWLRSDAYYQRTEEAVHELAKELRIHPAVIAGRIRRESNNYFILGDIVGQGQVRKLFSAK